MTNPTIENGLPLEGFILTLIIWIYKYDRRKKLDAEINYQFIDYNGTSINGHLHTSVTSW